MGNRRIGFFRSCKLNAVASDELRFRGRCVERQVAADGLLRGANACRRSTQRLKSADDRKVQAIEKCSLPRSRQSRRMSSRTTCVFLKDWFRWSRRIGACRYAAALTPLAK